MTAKEKAKLCRNCRNYEKPEGHGYCRVKGDWTARKATCGFFTDK